MFKISRLVLDLRGSAAQCMAISLKSRASRTWVQFLHVGRLDNTVHALKFISWTNSLYGVLCNA